MTPLLELSLKVSALALVGLATTATLRQHSAAFRHWILTVALACSVALPLLPGLVPAWKLPARDTRAASERSPEAVVAEIATVPAPAPSAVASQGTGGTALPIARLLVGAWMAGAIASVAILLVGFARLQWLTSRAHAAAGWWPAEATPVLRTYGLRRRVRVLETEHPTLLVTWGTLRPTILLPRGATTWSRDRVRVVLGHELAHLRRGDWVIQFGAELLRCAYWFNPLIWIACRRLRQESEYACDDLVLGLGIDRTAYATHLIELARTFRAQGHPWLPAPAIARPSTLQRRIRAMLDIQLNRTPLTRLIRFAVVVAFVGLAVPIAGYGEQATGISGTVQDQFGGPIPDATVIAVHAATGARHSVQTDASGTFRLSDVPPGDYTVSVRSMGFSTFREKLTLAGAVQRSITLEVGSLQETVTVRHDASSPERPSAEDRLSAVMPERAICQPSATGGRITPPRRVFDIRPAFPAHLNGIRTQAQVILDARIGTDGSMIAVQPFSSGDPDLEDAAIAAVSQWRFTPTELNCVPVEVRMVVSVNFESR